MDGKAELADENDEVALGIIKQDAGSGRAVIDLPLQPLGCALAVDIVE